MEKIKIGAVIEMVKSGKRYIVENKSASKITLRLNDRVVCFSWSALKDRIARKVAIVHEF